jgi:hypothetical protein
LWRDGFFELGDDLHPPNLLEENRPQKRRALKTDLCPPITQPPVQAGYMWRTLDSGEQLMAAFTTPYKNGIELALLKLNGAAGCAGVWHRLAGGLHDSAIDFGGASPGPARPIPRPWLPPSRGGIWGRVFSDLEVGEEACVDKAGQNQ